MVAPSFALHFGGIAVSVVISAVVGTVVAWVMAGYAYRDHEEDDIMVGNHKSETSEKDPREHG